MLHMLSLNNEITYFLKELPGKFILTPYWIFSMRIVQLEFAQINLEVIL